MFSTRLPRNSEVDRRRQGVALAVALGQGAAGDQDRVLGLNRRHAGWSARLIRDDRHQGHIHLKECFRRQASAFGYLAITLDRLIQERVGRYRSKMRKRKAPPLLRVSSLRIIGISLLPNSLCDTYFFHISLTKVCSRFGRISIMCIILAMTEFLVSRPIESSRRSQPSF
jgi:hypothetical protein